MNSKVAERIEIVAELVCVLEIIASIIVGIALISSENSMGFLVIIIGAFISWLSYLILYGFGELIENSEIIAKNISGIKSYNEDFKLNKGTTYEEKIDLLNDLKNKGLITEKEYSEKSEKLK